MSAIARAISPPSERIANGNEDVRQFTPLLPVGESSHAEFRKNPYEDSKRHLTEEGRGSLTCHAPCLGGIRVLGIRREIRHIHWRIGCGWNPIRGRIDIDGRQHGDRRKDSDGRLRLDGWRDGDGRADRDWGHEPHGRQDGQRRGRGDGWRRWEPGDRWPHQHGWNHGDGWNPIDWRYHADGRQ